MRNVAPLLIAATALALGSVAFVCSPSAPTPDGGGADPVVTAAGLRIHLADHLPPGYVTDGSVDYSPEFRLALELAENGELVLPNHPIRVSPAPGRNWCLRVTAPTTISGSTGSVIRCDSPAAQVLRVEDVHGLTLRGFTVLGPGGDGQGLGHGLIQVTGGRDVVVENVTVRGADADGIAIALVRGVRIEGCIVEGASKAALYANGSRGVVIGRNVVRDFGGHRTNEGRVVGIGIQLSSNRDLVCAHNVVEGGTGAGILCNANSGGAAPIGNVIEANRITSVGNPSNVDNSSGIRLANGAADKFTQTLVRGNSLRACGVYGIYVENHNGSLVDGNTVAESERSAIAISTSRDVVVTRNLLLNSGTSGLGGLHQVFLLNGADRALVEGNVLRRIEGAAQSSASDGALDVASGENVLVPRRTVGTSAPIAGQWSRGDLVLHAEPASGSAVGWICVASGTPGVWRALAPVE